MTSEDQDRRSWAEKRIDARRAAKGLPTSRSPRNQPADKFVNAAILFVLGFAIVSAGVAPVLGLVAWAAALYFLVAGAVQRGVQDGTEDQSTNSESGSRDDAGTDPA